MITTDLGVVNLALNHLGQKKLAALDTTTELGRKAEICYEPAVRQALRDIRPNFAKKRAIFHQVVDAEKTITGATQAEPVVITATSHGFSDGDQIAIYDVGGMTDLNGKMYLVANKTANTFEITDLNGNDIDGTEFDSYTSGGKCGIVSDSPAFGYTYRYTLPTDYIFMLEINGNDALGIDESIENNELLTDETEIKARYIYYNSTVSNWDIDFLMLCSYKLAEMIAMSVTNLSALAEKWGKKYENERVSAKGTKSQEAGAGSTGANRQPIINTLISSRSR